MSRAPWWVLIAFLCAIVIQCFVPPIVGSADNADFPKVIGWFDLGSPTAQEHFAQFVDLQYVFDPKFHYSSGFYSSECLLTIAAILVNRLVSPAGTFDLRVMGLVHAVVFLTAVCLLIPLAATMPRARHNVLLALIVGMFTDVVYVSYLNSFFMETASLLFFLLVVVAYLRAAQWHRALDRWLLIGSAVILVTSKTQHFPLALPIAGLLAWKGTVLTPDRSRRFGIVGAAILLAAGAFSARSAPPQYSVYGRYTMAFSQILPNTANLDEALADLGLDPADRRFVGTHAYAATAGVRDEAFTSQLGRRLSYVSLGRFYITHPRDALMAIDGRLSEAGRQRPYRGNFSAGTGLVGFSESHTFDVWSNWKARLFERHGYRYLLYAILLAALVPAGAILLKRQIPSGSVEGIVTLAVMLLLTLLVAGLGDALDAARHFLVFAALTDVLLLSAIYLVLVAFEQRRR